MTEAQVTLIVTQRERFSYTQRSLTSLYEHTTVPFKLIYVDGNSPKKIKKYLAKQAKEKGFRLIRTDYYITPNQGRNLCLSEVDTQYVVFVDNDVIFTPGWLEKLLLCAEETQAWLVAPLYFEGNPEEQMVHMAGGMCHFRKVNGKRRFYEKHRFAHQPLKKVKSELRREPTELIEFHCVLALTEIFQQIGLLDEQFMSTGEHWDLCLQVRERGGEIYFEPSSQIAYVPPPPFAWSDLPYYTRRWGEEWNQTSLSRFRQKWDLEANDPFIQGHYIWLNRHRQLIFKSMIRRSLPVKRDSWLFKTVLVPLEKRLSNFLGKSQAT